MPKTVSRVWIAAFLLAAGCSGPGAPRQGFVLDDDGRALVLHGFNVDDSSTYGPVTPGARSREDYELIASRGFNFLRMVLFWNGLEPAPGVYSEAYLDRVEEMLGWAQENDLLVLLDFHQDQYNTRYGGRGFPDWTVRDDGLPFYPLPWPLQSITPAVRRCYDHFWFDEDLQQAYEDAWMVVVNRFKDHPAVLGYDLMNEPFPGDMTIRQFELWKLPEFHERLAAAIRAVDAENYVFYEPISFYVNAGFLPATPPTEMALGKAVYAPHFYQLDLDARRAWDGDETIFNFWEKSRASEAAAQRAPMVLGEWGVPWNAVGTGVDDWVRRLDAMVDRAASGYAIWLFFRSEGGPFTPEGEPQPNLLPLIRAYARRIAGAPTFLGYDPATRILEVRFRETGVAAPTEIYVPEWRYPEGWTLETSDPDGAWSASFDAARGILTVATDPTRAEHAIRVAPEGA